MNVEPIGGDADRRAVVDGEFAAARVDVVDIRIPRVRDIDAIAAPLQQFFRQGSLADVHQHAGAGQVHQHFPRKAQVAAETGGQRAAVDGVAVAVGVAFAQRVQPEKGIGIANDAGDDGFHGAAEGLSREALAGAHIVDKAGRQGTGIIPGNLRLLQLVGQFGLGVIDAGCRQRPPAPCQAAVTQFLQHSALAGRGALVDIDVDVTTIAPELLDLAQGIDLESLQGKAGLGPWAIQPGHEHAQRQLIDSKAALLDFHGSWE